MKELIKKIKSNKLGLSITDLVKQTSYSRCQIRTMLARLEGANKVSIRQVGMAKLYSYNG